MKKIFYFVFISIIISCGNDNSNIKIPSESKIVVEGCIEIGDVPQVILSRSVPINTIITRDNALNYVLRSAKITVSDGVQNEVLSLSSNNNGRIPPYVYRGTAIIGQEGKTYNLKIEYLNRVVTASTTIPPTVAIQSVAYIKTNPADVTGFAHISFNDPINQKNYYQISTREAQKDSIFVPAFYGNLNDSDFASSNVSLKINKGISIYPNANFEPYFSDNKTVFIKLRTMNKDAFDFWNSWQNEIVNGQNPIFPSSTSLISNINGGVGLWAGYGQSTLTLQTIP